MTVDLYDLTPPPIPDLAKLWVDFGLTGTSTNGNGNGGRNSKAFPPGNGSKTDVVDKLKDVSIKDTTHSALLALKVAILRDVLTFCSDEGQEKYEEIMADLQSRRVQKLAIDHRLKRALEGKDAANKKYKAGDKLGALYTYAVAWSLLLPYHPDVYPLKPENGRDYRSEIGKAECALFSNMSAMALMVVKASDASDARKDRLCQIGIDASEVCISSKEYITAGLMAKPCRRAKERSELITSREIAPDRLRFFKEQEELLRGVDPEKMFDDLAKTQHARPAKV